jgi:hypothetical protein
MTTRGLTDRIDKQIGERVTGRFCEMAAVTPQKKQCLLASLPPAASLLSAATSQSRWDVTRHRSPQVAKPEIRQKK